MVTLGDPRFEVLRPRDGERHLDLSPRELPRELEAEGLEHAEHLPVVGDHLGDEPRDSVARCPFGELLDEPRADPALLIRVRDRKGGLGRRGVAEPHVARERYHTLGPVLDERSEQSATVVPVRIDHLLDEVVPEPRKPVEAQVEALFREIAEEAEDRVGVALGGRTQTERAPVPQDHVDDVPHARHSRRPRAIPRS
jgi:hypothetical protein